MSDDLEIQRKNAIVALQDSFAESRLDERSFEDRLERCFAARTSKELAHLVQDLRPHSGEVLARTPSRALAPMSKTRSLTIFSKQEHHLQGQRPPGQAFVAVMGELTIDLRGLRISEAALDLSVLSLMSKIRIIVPPGLGVELHSSNILGRLKKRLSPLNNPGPTLRVHAKLRMGSLEILECRPNESQRQAKVRHAVERRAIKSLSERGIFRA